MTAPLKNAACETDPGIAAAGHGRFACRRLSFTPRFRGVIECGAKAMGKFFIARVYSVQIAFTPCGGVDSLLHTFTRAAINADFGNVIVLAPACPSSESFKNPRARAGIFERPARNAPRRAAAGRQAGFWPKARHGRPLNLSQNGSRDFSLRRGFSEEKIPALNNQPKINITSNRKDASSAYPK